MNHIRWCLLTEHGVENEDQADSVSDVQTFHEQISEEQEHSESLTTSASASHNSL